MYEQCSLNMHGAMCHAALGKCQMHEARSHSNMPREGQKTSSFWANLYHNHLCPLNIIQCFKSFSIVNVLRGHVGGLNDLGLNWYSTFICLTHLPVCSWNPGRRNQNFYRVLTCQGPPYIPQWIQKFCSRFACFWHISYTRLILLMPMQSDTNFDHRPWPVQDWIRLNKKVINMGWHENWVRFIFPMNIEQI